MNAYTHITTHKIVAILRGTAQADVPAIVEALHRGGVRSVEVTLNTPGALEAITHLRQAFAGSMLVGAGTVLSTVEAEAAIHAGAEFIISPIVDSATIKATTYAGVLSIPGAYTATEIVQAYHWGAGIVKVFPAASPAYIKDLRGPLPHIPLMPTGGVHLQNVQQFLAAGAIALGIGSALVKGKALVNHDYLQQLTATAQAFVNAVSSTG